jgi:hypothetical protein
MVLQKSQAEIRDTKAVQQEATFYFGGKDSSDSCPKADPQEQRVLPYIPLQARYKAKSKV